MMDTKHMAVKPAISPETVEAIRKAYPDMDSILNDPDFGHFIKAHIKRIEDGRGLARHRIRQKADTPVQFKRTPFDWFLESIYWYNVKALVDAFNQIAHKRGGFSRSQREVITSVVHAAAKELVNSKAEDYESANVIRSIASRSKRPPKGLEG